MWVPVSRPALGRPPRARVVWGDLTAEGTNPGPHGGRGGQEALLQCSPRANFLCPHPGPGCPQPPTDVLSPCPPELCSGDVPEVEIVTLLGEQLPRYTLRADTVFGYDHEDWLRAPPASQPTAPLTPQQIEETLWYFRECPALAVGLTGDSGVQGLGWGLWDVGVRVGVTGQCRS